MPSQQEKSSPSKSCASHVKSGSSADCQILNAEHLMCYECNQFLAPNAYSRHQYLKSQAKCKACVDKSKAVGHAEPRLKRCVQCFQNVPKSYFSKRQAQLLDPKCKLCVKELSQAAIFSSVRVANKWKFDHYYRVCHRGKRGGVSVRVKHNIASPLLGYIPLGRVFRGTAPICNEQGDSMVRLEGPQITKVVVQDDSKNLYREDQKAERRLKEAWVPCRSIRNETLLESHRGPFVAGSENEWTSRFFRCVVEGCKVREQADLVISELGYVLYGDVVEVVESVVTLDGVVFLKLHERYFDGVAWVVERSLDNESVLNEIEGPWISLSATPRKELYRCVQTSGAPIRMEPELTVSPVGRIPCGAVVTVVERMVTSQRLVFLRVLDCSISYADERDTQGDKWVIETSSCCASVMIKVKKDWHSDRQYHSVRHL
ncbi:hypothetical protein Plhal304r1_c015g0055281 [Plasmopara halstedii]